MLACHAPIDRAKYQRLLEISGSRAGVRALFQTKTLQPGKSYIEKVL